MKKSATDEEYEIFCHNVRWLRKQYGLSKKRMAKLMEIAGSLTKLEKGIFPSRKSINVVVSIYRYFAVRLASQFTDRLGE